MSVGQTCRIQYQFYSLPVLANDYDVKFIRMKSDSPDGTIFLLKCGIASFAATYIAGVMHPLDLIKTRFQSHDGNQNKYNLVPKYEGVFKGLTQIYKAEGITGLYKGFYVSLMSQALATAFFFLLYEKRKLHYEARNNNRMDSVAFASCEASFAATLLTQPFWVVKTRMLLNTSTGIGGQLQHARQKTREIYLQNGMKGFLKGLSVSLVLSMSGVLQMYVYEGSKMLYERFEVPETCFWEKAFVCGSLSKLTSVLITYPFTTIRTRIQQNQYVAKEQMAKYSNVRDVATKVARFEGVHGFYKGLLPNLMKGIPQRGIYFHMYELLKQIFKADKQFQ